MSSVASVLNVAGGGFGVGKRSSIFDRSGSKLRWRSTPEFIDGQRKGSFAAFVRNVTDRGLSLQFPFGYLEQFPRATEAEMAVLRERIRARYAVYHSEVEQAITAHMGAAAVGGPEEKDVTGASRDWIGDE